MSSGDPRIILAAAVLTTHQRTASDACACGPLPLGSSVSEHQAAALAEAGLLIVPRMDPDERVCRRCGVTYDPRRLRATHPYRHPPDPAEPSP